MSYADVSAGKNPPEDIHAIIEIPSHGVPVKYEVDKGQDVLMVDRFLNTSMFYPCNYGYIPKTLSEDGDPVDILVITPHPIVPGAVIRCRPIGLLNMTDEAGVDLKILGVPIHKLTQLYATIQDIHDVSRQQLEMITHFFEQYKALEQGKWVKVEGWQSAEKAKEYILTSIQNFIQS